MPKSASIGTAKRQRIYARDEYTCVDCGRTMHPDDPDLTLDHIVPLMLGGTDADENLCVMCKPCNERKGHSAPADWKRSDAGWYRKGPL